MGHGPVTIPEEDASRPQVLQDVANLGQDSFWRASDYRMVGDLFFEGAPVGSESSPGTEGRRCQPPGGTRRVARKIHDCRIDLALIASQEGVAHTGKIFSANFLGFLFRLVDMNLP